MRRESTLVHFAAILISNAVPAGIALLALWQFHRTVVLLGAADQTAHPYLQLLANTNRARSFAFLIGILGVVYGLWQRSLRLRAVALLEQHLRGAKSP